jgi:hypothetical protein
MMMNEHTLHIGLIILMLMMLLVIIIYMTGAEVDMAEICKEPATSSTKICNGGLI